MTPLEAAILGLIQGITEWLPISSSGHLVLYQQIREADVPFFFDVLLHFASLLVILTVFRREIIGIFVRKDAGYIRNIVIGSVPVAVCGFFFRSTVESAFTSIRAVSVGLIFTGFILLLTRYGRDRLKVLRPSTAIAIGAAQAAALLPGVSRSGMTISTGMLLGVSREKAAEFSFILGLPAIFGATVFEMLRVESVEKVLIVPFVIGAVVSFVSGYFSLRLLLRLVQKGKIFWFSGYCVILGVILLFHNVGR